MWISKGVIGTVCLPGLFSEKFFSPRNIFYLFHRICFPGTHIRIHNIYKTLVFQCPNLFRHENYCARWLFCKALGSNKNKISCYSTLQFTKLIPSLIWSLQQSCDGHQRATLLFKSNRSEPRINGHLTPSLLGIFWTEGKMKLLNSPSLQVFEHCGKST